MVEGDIMHEELKEQLRQIAVNYNGKAFWAIINRVKKDRISDDELLKQIETTSLRRFMEKVRLKFSVLIGNLMEFMVMIAAIILAFQVGSDLMLYVSALLLMTTLHPLSHYLAGSFLGIRFTHYYLNGPAKIEPTLRIDYSSYLKISGKKRAVMHASGVIGTVLSPLIPVMIALNKGASGAAMNLFILFLVLIVFELLTSTRIGDLMRARREYRYG